MSDDGHTINIGYVHVLDEAPRCVKHCPHPDHSGRLTTTELLADLNERISRGIDNLMELREAPGTDVARLSGKIQALQLVQDWLRSYPNEEAAK